MSTCFMAGLSQDETVHEEADGQPPAEGDSSDEHEVTFVRPHDLELSRSRTTTTQLEATVRFVITAGSRVRLELVSKDSPQTIGSNSPKSAIASYGFNKAMWSLSTRNNYKYSKCPAPRR